MKMEAMLMNSTCLNSKMLYYNYEAEYKMIRVKERMTIKMKKTQNIANLITELEYLIADSCYNPNSYDGYTGEEGCAFRYPVWVYQNEKFNKYYGNIKDLTPEQISTIKYKFGSNHLFIGNGLMNVFNYLEKRYEIDFDDMEKKL